MIRFLLDTNHASLQERGDSALLAHRRRHPPGAVGFSVVTVEEALRGRLAVLARLLPAGERTIAYRRFWDTVRFFAAAEIVLYDEACDEKFQALRATKIRTGTRDLRIAASALVHAYTVVTRNRSDVARVPGLQKVICTGYGAPWMNGVCERFRDSLGRELLDHVIVPGERHLGRLVSLYMRYCHDDYRQLTLGKDPPRTRAVTPRLSPETKVVALPRVGGIHHRYE